MTTGTSSARESRRAPQLSSAPLPLSSDSDRPGPGLVTGNTRPSHPATRPHHGRRAPHSPGDPSHHPDGTGSGGTPGGLGDKRDEQGGVPGQAHLSALADAHARNQRGDGRARGGEHQGSARGLRARTRARQREGITGVGQIGRGQAHEGDRAADTFDDCVHPSTVRRHTRERLPARAPLWTTPTRNATLCIERSDGGPCG